MKVLHSMGSLRDPRAFPAFLYQVARNTAISRIRRQGTYERIESSVESLDGTLESPTDEVALYDQAEQVHHALDQLPLPQREALTLYFLQDLSLEEIATLIGVPIGTDKSRLHYGKLAIRKLLSIGDEHV